MNGVDLMTVKELLGHKARPGGTATRISGSDDVAALLQVQPSTIRKWVHMQSIPVVRVGRAVRFRRDEIARWVGERSETERTSD